MTNSKSYGIALKFIKGLTISLVTSAAIIGAGHTIFYIFG